MDRTYALMRASNSVSWSPQAVRNLLMTEIARARNEMVRKTVSLMADALEAGDVQEEEPAVLPDGDEVAA